MSLDDSTPDADDAPIARHRQDFWRQNNLAAWALGLLILITACGIGYAIIGMVRNSTTAPAATEVPAQELSQADAQATAFAAGMEAAAQTQAATNPTGTPAPALPSPTASLIPTLTSSATPQAETPATPTNTPVPVVSSNPYAWVDEAWNIPYSEPFDMEPGDKFEGPAICEWYDGAAKNKMAFKATYDAASATVDVIELHEAMFPLMEGESYTYPSGIKGTCWEIGSDAEVTTLMTTYRHLLFYSNVFGDDSDVIKSLKSEGKIWEGADVEAKPHAYMHTWLSFYGLGVCNFRDQTSCAILALVIVQPPLGTVIETK